MRAVYATRRRVMRAADVKASAYQSSEIDQALESASVAVDRLCHRGDATRPGFAPWTGTITYDWPVLNNASAYRFYLNQNSLLSLTSVISGGTTITSAALLRPETGPPYSVLDVDRATSSLFTISSGAGQSSLAIAGVWCGAPLDERTSTTWTAPGSLSSSATTATLAAPLDIGTIIRIDSERMIVTDQGWADSGQDGTLTAAKSAETLAVSDGTAFLIGEELLIDAERVLVRDIAGNTLVVQRAAGGSTLAVHTAASIYQARSCTLQRGALGTTATTHLAGAPVYVFRPPALIEQLTVAYALDQRAQETSGYARTVGSGEGERPAGGGGIRALEDRVWTAFGRKLRHRAV